MPVVVPDRIRIILILVFVAASFLVARADLETPVQPPEAFEIDPVHSMVLFRIHHQGAGQFWGRFNDVSGTVHYPRDDSIAPSLEIVVGVGSVDTGTEKLDRTLLGPDFFNGREFKDMTFTSTDARRLGEGKWEVTGELTLLGQTREVAVAVEVTGVRGNPVVAKAGWEAIFSIDRSDFGMNWGIDNGALGDTVRLIIGLEGVSGPPDRD